MQANTRLFIRPYQTYHSLKNACMPYVQRAVDIRSVKMVTRQPPRIDVPMQNTLSTGMNPTKATILGSTRQLTEFTPMISRASICSVTLIVPISEAMFEPTFPARIRQRMELENSSNTMSRVARPTEQAGISGFDVLSFIWIVHTAPMNTEMTMTSGMESTPSFVTS